MQTKEGTPCVTKVRMRFMYNWNVMRRTGGENNFWIINGYIAVVQG